MAIPPGKMAPMATYSAKNHKTPPNASIVFMAAIGHVNG
jgi:hypothetical protein